MRTTIRDLARLSGVSTSTVSRVLTGNPHVSQDVREKVANAISQTGFVPNGNARGLQQKKRNIFAVVVPQGYNAYYDEIVKGINKIADSSGINIILVSQNENARRSTIERILEIGVDGIIHMGALENDSIVPMLKSTETPFVMLCRDHDIDADKILFDDLSAGKQITSYLLSLGHRKLAYIYGDKASKSSKYKYDGFISALKEYYLEPDVNAVIEGGLTSDGGYLAMKELLKRRKDGKTTFTAVVAGNDIMMFGARKAILEEGLIIPKDLSIAGMDDIFWSGVSGLELTTVNSPKIEMGEKAVTMLLERIENPDRPSRTLVLDTRLVIRKSCSSPLNG